MHSKLHACTYRVYNNKRQPSTAIVVIVMAAVVVFRFSSFSGLRSTCAQNGLYFVRFFSVTTTTTTATKHDHYGITHKSTSTNTTTTIIPATPSTTTRQETITTTAAAASVATTTIHRKVSYNWFDGFTCCSHLILLQRCGSASLVWRHNRRKLTEPHIHPRRWSHLEPPTKMLVGSSEAVLAHDRDRVVCLHRLDRPRIRLFCSHKIP